jgi:transcriptional regulator with XRE-family HTH domain
MLSCPQEESNMDMEFMYRLRMAMENKGITASELSRISGVGKSDISYYLKGKYVPKQDKCYMLAKALDVDPGWLMTGFGPSKDVLDALETLADEAESIPQTKEAKIISAGIDKMSPERREKALKVLQTIFAEYFDGGKEDET